mmetsp:Transcript_9501/g.14102  ORF Transcript_9501/g.14102 Transcript_9501/m.14102 type:complete len:104 (-) Transcript_9501:320-631(-)
MLLVRGKPRNRPTVRPSNSQTFQMFKPEASSDRLQHPEIDGPHAAGETDMRVLQRQEFLQPSCLKELLCIECLESGRLNHPGSMLNVAPKQHRTASKWPASID